MINRTCLRFMLRDKLDCCTNRVGKHGENHMKGKATKGTDIM